jgi:hypothetical protein
MLLNIELTKNESIDVVFNKYSEIDGRLLAELPPPQLLFGSSQWCPVRRQAPSLM